MKFSDKFPKLNIYKVLDSDKDHLEDEQPEEQNAKFKADVDNYNVNVDDGNIEEAVAKETKGYLKESYFKRYINRTKDKN